MSNEEKEYSFMHRMWVFKRAKKSTEDFSKLAKFDDNFEIGGEEEVKPSVETEQTVKPEEVDTSVPQVEIKPKVIRKIRKISVSKKTETPVQTSKPDEGVSIVKENEPLVQHKNLQPIPSVSNTETTVAKEAVSTEKPKVKRVIRKVIKKSESKPDTPAFTGLSGLKK